MLFLAFPGPMELWPVLLIVVVLFGAKKLPGLARAVGSSVNQFKKGLSEEGEKTDELSENASEPSKESAE